jgi:branched-chain amino acid transport system ATP-binding protein
MADAILDVAGVTKNFGGFTALAGVDLRLGPNERLGLIGPNGSGKTTLINCISGALLADSGTIRFQGADITRMKAHQRTRLGIARSFQIPKPFRSMTVLENICIPLEYAGRRQAGRPLREEALEILSTMGMADLADSDAGSLTQIDLRKLELARALAARPALLVSDEAMAGLSGNEVDEILAILMRVNEQGVAIIMIEHIMRAVMRFSERVICLDAGQKIAEGVPDDIVHDPNVERAYLGE